ncbi:MAG: 30S ribosomal protein S2 [Candidatus Vogelbacteria bacterium CG22_combo_CG10-13_8_21_14_all_37_9]|uniref:Small ribosomal subunit protein uS2 n=1 Tax=Candidatus Vogelbacteria bacterium CG22_combo_CG10-13_8_21_14_all_37_9 TaxID=1975046 RepID=A0A2H0BL23_9BACT|nr:MAG: 30S ribosomal protein S2 [Candidatus Vogelbacteria bacterium CG22_combo_CG10-13_8_21_14_all_37_9]
MSSLDSEQIKNDNSPLIKEMFKAGVHYGYSRERRHPSISDFIFGYKNKTAIIDIEKTIDQLTIVNDFVKDLAKAKKQILFVGNKPEARSPMERGAKSINQPYVTLRWIGGTLTNFKEISKRLNLLASWKEKGEKGELAVYTKKERLLISKEVEELEQIFGGITNLSKLPSALFVIDAKSEAIAIAEAKLMKIPVIAVANSDCSIDGLDYPLVANDASGSSINFFVHQIATAYKEGLTMVPEISPTATQTTPATSGPTVI